ncbi:CAMK family protein kinase [Tritrichomonas foetus]|uniref:CAMK family protein kinase n=1 Tax=Tritrichomonas foetus TaxID=1144522 RepID=A0A1J4KVQ8_9EUKA|nr:CAMK family protein kinase [Tritrichomonas foetus]|eukprot:OHT15234.1 CAMK family protein kinase [Tritrichomonas foetus]
MFRKRCTVSSTFSKIHDYFVGDPIGNGFFSTIHAAFSTKAKNSFAIKILLKDQIIRCPRGDRILFNEGVLAALLDHPHIVRIQEIIESKHQIFQVMQFATHKDLLTYLRHNELDLDTAIRMMDQLLSSVEYLHSLGVCHRDIKLENILLTDNLSPVLSDFGLSSIPFANKLHNHCGSKGYVAPEAISDPQFDGYKADIFSLGVVFYIMFTRSMPFQEDNLDFEAQINSLDFSRVPPDVQRLIRAMWAKNPADRPAAAQCRALPLFDRVENRTPPPQPMIMALTNPILQLDDIIVSRLSQTLHIPIATFFERVANPGPRLEKLLAILFIRKLDANSVNSTENVFKMNYSHTSQPVRNIPQMQRLDFMTSSSVIINDLNSFMMARSCCITSPLSLERSIVLNSTTGDAKIDFELNDTIKSGTCTLILTGDKRSIQLMGDLVEYLQKKFREQSVI